MTTMGISTAIIRKDIEESTDRHISCWFGATSLSRAMTSSSRSHFTKGHGTPERGEHFDRGGLAGTVGAEQPEHFAGLRRDRLAVHGNPSLKPARAGLARERVRSRGISLASAGGAAGSNHGHSSDGCGTRTGRK